MSQKRRKIDIVSLHTARAAPTEIDWERCFICQNVNKEKLQSRFNSPLQNNDAKKAYGTLAENIKWFQSLLIGQLPVCIPIEKLDNGGQLKDELHQNKARYHKSCKLKFAASKLSDSQQNQPSASQEPTAQ